MVSITQKTLSFITILSLFGAGFMPMAFVSAEEVATEPVIEEVEPSTPSEEPAPVDESVVEEESPATDTETPEESTESTDTPIESPTETEPTPATEEATTTEEVAPVTEEVVGSSTESVETPEETTTDTEQNTAPVALSRLVSDYESETITECVDQLEGDWSDYVVSANQAKRFDGSDVLADRSVAQSALDNLAIVGSTGFFSLGFGGSIVVAFDNYVIDVSGNDVTVFETTNLPYPVETALVEVSQDNATWEVLGTAAQPGASSFDIASTGLSWFKYVRITDTTDRETFSNYPDSDGFDVNAVRAFSTVCDEPVPPTYTITGYKWNDLDADGGWDEGEPGLPGWTIKATNEGDSEEEYTDVTGENGSYSIEVPAGVWIVTEVNQEGWEQTAPVDPNYCVFEFGEIMYEAAVLLDSPSNSCDFGNHKKAPAAQCLANTNLIENGSFETPDLPVDGFGWDIFDSALSGLAWIVEWLNLAKDSPVPAKLELQSGYYAASAGAQYAELDSNWTPAPGAPYYGEDARVRIYQTIATVPGATYTVSYDFSPLPRYGTSTNALSVLLDGAEVALHLADGTGLTDTAWNTYTYSFVATSSTAVVGFADAGDSDTFGTLLDNVMVTCVPEVEEEVEEEEPTTSTSRGSRGGRRSTSSGNLPTPTPTPTPLVLGEQVSVVPQGAPGAGHGGTSTTTQFSWTQLMVAPRDEKESK